MQIPIANPVGKNPKRTRSIRPKKKSKARRKVKNFWPGEKARHSRARATGHAGPSYRAPGVSKITGKPLAKKRKKRNPAGLVVATNPSSSYNQHVGETMKKKKSKKKSTAGRRHKNPSVSRKSRRGRRAKRHYTKAVKRHKNPGAGSAVMQALSVAGGVLVGQIGAKVIGNFGEKAVGGMLPDAIKPYAKPVIELGVGAAAMFLLPKVSKNTLFNAGVTGGAIAAGVLDGVKAVAPGVAGILADYTGETAPIQVDDILNDITNGGSLSDLSGEDESNNLSEDELSEDDSLSEDETLAEDFDPNQMQ